MDKFYYGHDPSGSEDLYYDTYAEWYGTYYYKYYNNFYGYTIDDETDSTIFADEPYDYYSDNTNSYYEDAYTWYNDMWGYDDEYYYDSWSATYDFEYDYSDDYDYYSQDQNEQTEDLVQIESPPGDDDDVQEWVLYHICDIDDISGIIA